MPVELIVMLVIAGVFTLAAVMANEAVRRGLTDTVYYYHVFPELSAGKQFFGVRRTTRTGFMRSRRYYREVLHYFETEKEAYQFILECRRKDQQ